MRLFPSVFVHVMQRHRAGPLTGAVLWLAVRCWKLLRHLPVVNRVRIVLPVADHRLRVRLFSYDDLLTASANYEAGLALYWPSPGAVAIDAGAFIGRHTLSLARAVGPTGRVLAIEPHPAHWDMLSENVELNSYKHVECIPCALGARTGQAKLRFDRESSTASLCGPGDNLAVVEVLQLDELLSDRAIRTIDFLKVDVEGYEREVLTGAREALTRSRATIVVERHDSPTMHASLRCPIAALLAEFGYNVTEHWEGPRAFYVARPSSLSERSHARHSAPLAPVSRPNV